MLKIILVRHGEEERRKTNGIEYQTDNCSLTSKGIEQAKKLASKLRVFNITEIYSSNIKRAIQTAEIMNKEIGVNIKIDKGIRERNIGDFEKYGVTWRKEFNKLKERELAKGTPLIEIRPPNGENLYDFRGRIKSFLNELSKKEGNILVSAHKGVNTAIINFAQGRNIIEFKPIEQNHACINILNFENNKWNVLIINDISHLEKNEI